MILGFALIVAGYSVFYWGIHHFPGVDCPAKDGGAKGCRYSLLDVLGVPQSWGIQKGSPLMIVPGSPPPQGTSSNNPNNSGQNSAGTQSPPPPPNQTQPQAPQNNTTPSNLAPSPTVLNPGQSPPQGTSTLPGSTIPGVFGTPPPASSGGTTPAPSILTPLKTVYCTACCNPSSFLHLFGLCPGCNC
jgi:hypothetical protein